MNSLYRINNRVMGKYFFAIGIIVMMMSCGKDIDEFVPRASQVPTGDISRLMTRLQSDIAGDVFTKVSCPCSGDQVFKIDRDLVMVIPPDFVDLTQYPCTNGSFDIYVTVCDTKGEILIGGIPTVSEGKLLESRIELNIEIGDSLSAHVKLAHGKQIRLLVNDPDPRDRMELFYGEDEVWVQADQNPNTWDNVTNSEWWFQDSAQQIISGFGYEFFTDSLDWINVDVFFEIPAEQRTSVCIDLPDEFTNTNTLVFMVFDDYKSILALRGEAETMQFCEPYGATPIGFNVTFVVLSEMGEDSYMFAQKNTVITPGHVEIITPKNTPYEEIKKYITTL